MKKYALVIIMAVSVVFTACNSNSSKNGSEASAKTSANEMTATNDKDTLLAVGGSCEMCKDRIEKTASKVPGVTSASYDLENKQLHLHFDGTKTNLEIIRKALTAVVFPTRRSSDLDKIYNALPACCKYRKP